MDKSFRYSNIVKGSFLEDTAKNVLSATGFSVKQHSITESGVDIEAFTEKRTIVCECWNHYGGWVHEKRLLRVIENLAIFRTAEKYLICAGTNLSRKQLALIKGCGITPILIHKQLTHINEYVDLIAKGLDVGVITSYSSRGYHTRLGYLIDILDKRVEYLGNLDLPQNDKLTLAVLEVKKKAGEHPAPYTRHPKGTKTYYRTMERLGLL